MTQCICTMNGAKSDGKDYMHAEEYNAKQQFLIINITPALTKCVRAEGQRRILDDAVHILVARF